MFSAGATMIGKTVTEELAYSIVGENAHYGAPVNVNAPGRVAGGSSSGSAAAVAAKSRFLAAASHDIRQPLHALGLLVGALKDHVEGDRGSEMVEQAEHATEALRGLMDELLDVSRLDAGVVGSMVYMGNPPAVASRGRIGRRATLRFGVILSP